MLPHDLNMSAKHLTSIVRWLLLAAVLCAAWHSGQLLAAHDGGWSASPDDAARVVSPCGLGALPGATCQEVIDSRWGSFDFYLSGRRILIPTSLIGFAYFVVLGIWLAMAPPGLAASRTLDRVWRAVTATGLIASVCFMGVMLLALHAWCPACMIIHALNAVVFAGVWWITRNDQSRNEANLASGAVDVPHTPLLGRLIASATTVTVCATLGIWLYFEAVSDAKHEWRTAAAYRTAYENLRENPDLVMREFLAQPRQTLRDQPFTLVGQRDADPRVTLFTDFDCPACACFLRAWQQDLNRNANEALKLDIRFLPRIANTNDSTWHDAASVRAALAAQAARMQAGDTGMARVTKLLFAHRHDANGRDYEALARDAGLKVKQFLSDMESPAARERILSDLALARALGVEATPAVFVDDRRVPPLCMNSKTFWSTVAQSHRSATPGPKVSTAQGH